MDELCCSLTKLKLSIINNKQLEVGSCKLEVGKKGGEEKENNEMNDLLGCQILQ